MNLVDAIRKASMQSGADQKQAAQAEPVQANSQESNAAAAANHGSPIAGASDVYEPHEISPAVIGGAGSVVRLELFLSPEQMHQMLRGILAGAHSVMTLREAARHLRTSIQSVVTLAESGDIPAFMVDGDWKFPRQGVEEWMSLQSIKTKGNYQEDQKDVA